MCDETVFTAARGSGSDCRTYHTDRDCPRLKPARRVHEYSRRNVAKTRDLCAECAGTGADPTQSDHSAYRAVRDADPEDVGGQT